MVDEELAGQRRRKPRPGSCDPQPAMSSRRWGEPRHEEPRPVPVACDATPPARGRPPGAKGRRAPGWPRPAGCSCRRRDGGATPACRRHAEDRSRSPERRTTALTVGSRPMTRAAPRLVHATVGIGPGRGSRGAWSPRIRWTIGGRQHERPLVDEGLSGQRRGEAWHREPAWRAGSSACLVAARRRTVLAAEGRAGADGRRAGSAARQVGRRRRATGSSARRRTSGCAGRASGAA